MKSQNNKKIENCIHNFSKIIQIEKENIEKLKKISMILERYNKFVKPSYEKYVKDTKKYSNLIIPFGVENYPFLDVFCHIFCKYTHKN